MNNHPKKTFSRSNIIVGGFFVALGIIGAIAGQSPSNNTSAASTIIQPVAQYQQTQPLQEASAKTTVLSNNNYYTNSDGNTIHSPAYSNSIPANATAQCRDGSYSYSQHRSGTCSHHGGVSKWL